MTSISKIQTIILLFVFIVVIFSMDAIFGNPLKESFKGINGTGLGYIGQELNYTAPLPNKYKGNMGYPGPSYLNIALPPSNYVVSSDDHPLSFGFPSTM
jgi:hypothetical protein